MAIRMICLSQARNQLACDIASELAYRGFGSGETQYRKISKTKIRQTTGGNKGVEYNLIDCSGSDPGNWEVR